MNIFEFLNEEYDLINSAGVKNTARRTEKLNWQPIDRSNVEASIGNFLDRYHAVLTNRTPEGQKGRDALKRMIFAKHIIKPEEIPETYWEQWMQEKWIPWNGRGDTRLLELQKQEVARIISEQKQSLERWIDFLSDETTPYNPAIKYWILQSVTGLQRFHSKRNDFAPRNQWSTEAFPELNREALAQTVDSVIKYITHKDASPFNPFRKSVDFSDIYAYFTIHHEQNAKAISDHSASYHHGNLELSAYQTLPKDFKFPGAIGWNLNLSTLKTFPKWVKLPHRIQWDLDMSALKALPEGFEFPEYIGWNLFLWSLTAYPKWVNLPKHIGRGLFLSALTTLPEGIEFPEIIWWELDLSSVVKLPKSVQFPKHIGWYLNLSSLATLPKWVKFPEKIGWRLHLNSLRTLPEDFEFPKEIWHLDLFALRTFPEGVKLPERIGWQLNLPSLTEIPSWIRNVNARFIILPRGEYISNDSDINIT